MGMMGRTLGAALVCGVREPKPIVAPASISGCARVRMRNNSFAVMYIKTAEGVRVFAIEDDGKFWRPGPEIGANRVVPVVDAGANSTNNVAKRGESRNNTT